MRRVILYFITIIINQAIRNWVFTMPSLTSATRVFQIRNKGLVPYTLLRWKEFILKIPIFCCFDGTILSANCALPYSKLRDNIKLKAFRKGAANIVNTSKALDAIYNQIMVEFDIQNAVLNKEPENGLIWDFTHISIMRDPRAAKDMVPDEIKVLSEKIKTKRVEHKKRIISEYPIGEKKEDYIARAIELHISEYVELAEILINQLDGLNDEGLLQLRIHIANLIVALCLKREIRRALTNVIVKKESPELNSFLLLIERTDKEQFYEERTFSYYQPIIIYNHFNREHGEALQFKHLNHFKNHVKRIYNIRLRA
ncbi:hypothetical protein QBC46DRAFT_365767 [Diplogelasinospora grovesii]|uniref:Uncharacterized protein n=1 Tax=Diplogelasinospora grovesii TaxID=303347 RepID=A0AAN6N3A0_9PEZI|nr:hypothetical protein QBC46DRAFT_365767 [Diplogelasinospora grovesii]